ncbi:MAG: cation:proton antiporter [Gammaproteobacteria bacterium]|nr:cation:proton antiporter [Gammaproteobacteria bacterium]
MDVSTIFFTLVVLLVSARVFAELASRLHAPPVIGELLAGILLGPSLFGVVEPNQLLKLLAEIGIILLLFEVGLETDLKQLVRSGLQSTSVAILGVILPLGFGFFVSFYLFDLSFLVSLFIGSALTATSIGITVRVLTDLGHHQSREGQIVIGAAVIDDVIGVILLAVLYEFATSGTVSVTNAARVALFVGTFFLLAPVMAKLVSTVIKKVDGASAIPGTIPTTVVSLVLFSAWLAHAMGAPELLGGFAAGLALSRRFFFPFGRALRADPEFAHRIEEQMKPIAHLFTPIFFVMVGVSLNLRDIDWTSPTIWWLSSGLLLAAAVGKFATGFVVSGSWKTRAVIGTAMVPRGEVGLIFAELGRAGGVLNNEIYAALVFVIALTTLVPPFILKWLYREQV